MNVLWSNLWEFIISLSEAGLFFTLADGKLNGRKFRRFYFSLSAALFMLAGLIFICSFLPIHPVFAVFILTFAQFLSVVFFYEDSVSRKIVLAIFFSAARIAADALSAMLPAIILKQNLSDFFSGGILRIPLTLLYIGILSIIVLISFSFTNRTFRPDNIQKILLITLSFLCISLEELIILAQAASFSNYYEVNRNNLIHLITFLGKILFVTLIIIFYTIGAARERNIKAREQKIMTEMENKQYRQIIQSVSELRILKHDLSNHLHTLQTMLDNNRVDESRKYLAAMTGTLSQSYFCLSSGNTPIDCIVTCKLKEAQTYGIPVDYSIHLSSRLPLTDIELCSLIGNLFDNAFDCCRRLKREETNIHFTIKPFQDMISLQISNSFDGIFKQDKNGKFLSIKDPDNPEHGIGLKRIQDIVEHHQGFLQIEPCEDVFRISILLPCLQTEENTEEA